MASLASQSLWISCLFNADAFNGIGCLGIWLAHRCDALVASSQSLARHGTERSRHVADPLSESLIRSACKSCLLAQQPEAHGTKQHEVRQLAEGHAKQDSSDGKQFKLGCAIYPNRAWSETYLTDDSLAHQ